MNDLFVERMGPDTVVSEGLTSRENGEEQVVLDSLSDEELLEALKEGKKEAVAVLFRRYARAVYSVAWRVLRDESEADDLRQEVFLYVFERVGSFDRTRATAISWMLQIAYHRAIDRRRYLALRNHYQNAELDDARFDGRSVGPTSAEFLDARAILEVLEEELPPLQRKTLELHICEGYSFREIAEHTGQSLGNVRHHYYRAIERLRSNLFGRGK